SDTLCGDTPSCKPPPFLLLTVACTRLPDSLAEPSTQPQKDTPWKDPNIIGSGLDDDAIVEAAGPIALFSIKLPSSIDMVAADGCVASWVSDFWVRVGYGWLLYVGHFMGLSTAGVSSQGPLPQEHI
ncbi:unnamed protein product, partial [Linum tenue]